MRRAAKPAVLILHSRSLIYTMRNRVDERSISCLLCQIVRTNSNCFGVAEQLIAPKKKGCACVKRIDGHYRTVLVTSEFANPLKGEKSYSYRRYFESIAWHIISDDCDTASVRTKLSVSPNYPVVILYTPPESPTDVLAASTKAILRDHRFAVLLTRINISLRGKISTAAGKT